MKAVAPFAAIKPGGNTTGCLHAKVVKDSSRYIFFFFLGQLSKLNSHKIIDMSNFLNHT